MRSDLLQLNLSYSRFWKNNSVVVRAGQLSSAFGSFLLRYDDADNPLLDMPLTYGYYYRPVTTYALTGAQVDATLGRIDLRAQFVNSSASNRRSVFDSDQYGNWAGGVGYTILQGLRIGGSGFRGPYLHRQHRYYLPGEGSASRITCFRSRHRCGVGSRALDDTWRVAIFSTVVPRDAHLPSEGRLRRGPSRPSPKVVCGGEDRLPFRERRWHVESTRTCCWFPAKSPSGDQNWLSISQSPTRQGNTFAVQVVTTLRAISLSRFH